MRGWAIILSLWTRLTTRVRSLIVSVTYWAVTVSPGFAVDPSYHYTMGNQAFVLLAFEGWFLWLPTMAAHGITGIGSPVELG